ncbi:hypothetical protein ACQCU3_06170 [Bacillus altitudinis]|uniref:hypothetical protein n=1 Tax=Bacillus altitudinis TaxID=293387 RepID=UPI0011E923B8|nr:hypothetical protein [Bacillus altitudinis]TYS28357.1 hypothetical protein FZC69_08650 [Bacillus altitudinis]
MKKKIIIICLLSLIFIGYSIVQYRSVNTKAAQFTVVQKKEMFQKAFNMDQLHYKFEKPIIHSSYIKKYQTQLVTYELPFSVMNKTKKNQKINFEQVFAVSEKLSNQLDHEQFLLKNKDLKDVLNPNQTMQGTLVFQVSDNGLGTVPSDRVTFYFYEKQPNKLIKHSLHHE